MASKSHKTALTVSLLAIAAATAIATYGAVKHPEYVERYLPESVSSKILPIIKKTPSTSGAMEQPPAAPKIKMVTPEISNNGSTIVYPETCPKSEIELLLKGQDITKCRQIKFEGDDKLYDVKCNDHGRYYYEYEGKQYPIKLSVQMVKIPGSKGINTIFTELAKEAEQEVETQKSHKPKEAESTSPKAKPTKRAEVNNSEVSEAREYIVGAKVSPLHTNDWALPNSERAIWDQVEIINSDRYKGEKPTEIEKACDAAVDAGDLPIKALTLGKVDALRKSQPSKTSKTPEYTIVQKQDALKLYQEKFYGDAPAVVQVASQFNGLESPGDEPSAVGNWIGDRTQGPRASLQSILACKHREAAHLKGKLPDAIHDLLQKCKLEDGRSILEKFPALYKNGYLRLGEILLGNQHDWEQTARDLTILRDYLKKNIGDLGFLSQWVLCNDKTTKQLQVFNAAPSYQGELVSWSDTYENVIPLQKEICEILVVNQYKATAQAAAILARETGKQVPLHLTLVGQGAFNNPSSVVGKALEAVKKELEGTDVHVYLHGFKDEEVSKWSTECIKLGITANIVRV